MLKERHCHHCHREASESVPNLRMSPQMLYGLPEGIWETIFRCFSLWNFRD